MDCSTMTVETITNIIGTSVTAFTAVVAIIISVAGNHINKKQYQFSSKPIVECYLDTYKTDDKTPYVVLVTENFGNLTARNIKITVDYPDGIVTSAFGEAAVLLGETQFTLAPHTKLSTPICWSKDKEMVVDGEIKINGEFSYKDIDNKGKKCKIPQTVLTIDEFNLFNAINKAQEASNNGQP